MGRFWFTFGFLAVFASALPAQGGFRWPEHPKNLKVLPDSIGGERLGQVMRRFTNALGVRCEHCHVGQGDLSTFDFASDDKPAKNRARVMMKMVQAINGTHMAELDVPADQRLAVTCVICHRGAARPVMLDALLEATIDSAGIDAAVGRYDELKKRYYGGFTYDFSRGMLTALGERLVRRQKYPEAVKVLELEVANNGDDVRTLVTLGSAQVQAGDRDGAKKSFDRALAMAPENMRPMIQQQIDRASKTPPSHD
jgi:hypothetical protein